MCEFGFCFCSGKTSKVSLCSVSSVGYGVELFEEPASTASMTTERDIQKTAAEFSSEKDAMEPDLDVPEEMEEDRKPPSDEVEFTR
jgi:hypothetical protein